MLPCTIKGKKVFPIFRPYEGRFEDSTEMRNQYQSLVNVKRSERVRQKDNLRPLKGRLQDTTESKNQYQGHNEGELTRVARPITNMKTEGDRDWETGKNEYKSFDISSHKVITGCLIISLNMSLSNFKKGSFHSC